MREANNIRKVEQLGIDLMGFIFWPKSSRYVSMRPSYLPEHSKRVGVFVNEEAEQVKRIAKEFQLDFIQLHGNESPAYIRQLALPTPTKIIKAFNIATPDDLVQTESYSNIVDYFLFDTKGKSVGGNGEKFDWTVLDFYTGSTPFLLSGGIGPDDAERVRNFHHDKCIGIDLNSKFETAPALKNINDLETFIKELSI